METTERMSEIYDFADIGDFIDQPVTVVRDDDAPRICNCTNVEPDLSLLTRPFRWRCVSLNALNASGKSSIAAL